MAKAKSYTIWAIIRKRTPGEKETKWQYRVSRPMNLEMASKLLKIKNQEDKESRTEGGIEYQTSFTMRKSMESIENILPMQFQTKEDMKDRKEIEVDEREFEELNNLRDSGFDDEIIIPVDAEKIKKKHPHDPILLIPSEIAGEPAEITTIVI